MDTGQTPPPRSGVPLAGVIGIAVLALIGGAMLTYALINAFSNPATPTSQPIAQVTSPPTQVVIIPTATSAPSATPEPTQPPATDTPTAPSDTPPPQASPTTSGPMVVALFPANVRSGPGVNYPPIGGLDSGSQAEAIGRDASGTWYVISYAGGRGWISNQVARYNGDVNALPVIQAPPPPATATPVPPTATSAPAATATTAAGARGVRGDFFGLQTTAREFAVNQDIWFEFKVTNTSSNTIPYRCLGAKVPNAPIAQCSWGSVSTDALKPGDVIEWNDHINIASPGTYTLVLGICYLSDTNACVNSPSNGWEILSGGIQVTVR